MCRRLFLRGLAPSGARALGSHARTHCSIVLTFPRLNLPEPGRAETPSSIGLQSPLPEADRSQPGPDAAPCCTQLGDPQDHLPPVIHVAGTNGKGSTCAFLRAIGEAAGWRVHVTTSPHLVHLRERFRVAGALVDDAVLADTLAEIERVNAGQAITVFEALAARHHRPQHSKETVPHRTCRGLHMDAGAKRIASEEPRHDTGGGPGGSSGCAVAHAAPNSSVTARSTRGPAPASSSGLRRKRCRSAGSATRRRCAGAIVSAPSKAASARAARNKVSSPRNPSVPSAIHSRAASSSTASGVPMLPRRTRAARMRLPRSRSASAQ